MALRCVAANTGSKIILHFDITVKKYLIPAAIILVAAFFRLYRLDELPPGLHYDEAFNATMAQRVLAGVERPLYFTEDLTEEPMAIYTASLFFGLFGASAFSLRLVSAFVGILTVAAVYFCARSFAPVPFGEGGWGLGLLSAFILAILYWHINFSRLGMEPIFLPLMLTLGIGFLLRAIFHASPVLRGRERGWGLAGLFLALTLYTYKAALFVPIFISAFLLSEIIFNRAFLRQNARGLAVFFATAVLVFAPLGLYWATHPGEFIERPSTVLATPATYIHNALQVGAMFFLHGDENPRSNLPGRAALDPWLAIGFIIGIIVCLARFKHRVPHLLLIWLGAMVLPSVLTDFAPHFGRSIAVAPAIALITAYGFTTLAERIFTPITRIFAKNDSRGLAGKIVLTFFVLLFSFSTFSAFNDYFNIWAARTGQFESFDVGLLSLAQKLRTRPPNETLFLTPVERDHYTIQFGLQGADANSFNGSYALVLPESGSAGAYGIVTRSDPRTLTRLQKFFPSGRAVETVYDFAGQPYAVIFRVEGTGQPLPSKQVNARLGDQIALLGYDAVRTGNDIALTLYWGSLAEARADYTVFVHLLDSSGRVIAQDDAQPAHRSYPTSRWRAGQVVLDDYHLVVPPGARDELKIEIGMYVLDTGARLRVTDVNGAPMENDRVLIERFALP